MRCYYCLGQHPSAEDVRRCFQRASATSVGRGVPTGIRTLDDVRCLLADRQRLPGFGALLDAIAICRGARDDVLLERCVGVALSAVTGEVPENEWKPVVLEAARSLLRAATYETLPSAARSAATSLRTLGDSYRQANSHGPVGEEVHAVARQLDELAVLLADEGAASLVSACSRLRDLERPDLGIIAASKAIEREPLSGPARTTRAGAALDQGNMDAAFVDLTWLESNSESFYSANTRSRAERMRDNLGAALFWAREASRRDPDGVAGMLSLAAAAKLAEDTETLQWALSNLDGGGGRKRSANYPAFIAAKDLLRAGSAAAAMPTLKALADKSYAPAVRLLLEYEAGRTHNTGGSSAPQRRD